jgi:hypothetical protein
VIGDEKKKLSPNRMAWLINLIYNIILAYYLIIYLKKINLLYIKIILYNDLI